MPRKPIVKEPEVVQPLPEQLLDIKGVMALLNIGRNAVFHLMNEQALPHFRWGKGRLLRFDPREIAKWLESQKQTVG